MPLKQEKEDESALQRKETKDDKKSEADEGLKKIDKDAEAKVEAKKAEDFQKDISSFYRSKIAA